MSIHSIPCEDCIVKMMCKDLCPDLIEFVENYISRHCRKFSGEARVAALLLRRGWIELTNDDFGWRYVY